MVQVVRLCNVLAPRKEGGMHKWSPEQWTVVFNAVVSRKGLALLIFLSMSWYH
jgi:hypothetical protein